MKWAEPNEPRNNLLPEPEPEVVPQGHNPNLCQCNCQQAVRSSGRCSKCYNDATAEDMLCNYCRAFYERVRAQGPQRIHHCHMFAPRTERDLRGYRPIKLPRLPPGWTADPGSDYKPGGLIKQPYLPPGDDNA